MMAAGARIHRRLGGWLLAAGLAGLASLAVPGTAPAADSVEARLQAVVESDHRPAVHRKRDADRHPVKTLTFFGIEPDMTVMEISPYGGWYTEILAPFLKAEGQLYAAIIDASEMPGFERYNREYRAFVDFNQEVLGDVKIATLRPNSRGHIAPPGTVDTVLSFRHMHEWTWFGIAENVLRKAYRALKPGGILGVVEHRAKDPAFVPEQRGKGRVGEQYAIDLIESVGFKLIAESPINNNPKDTKDYLRGVWMLPPNLNMPAEYRKKYEAIGEPDRFTLKFVKPAE